MAVKIKICGLTRDCDIDYVNQAGPDYAGFVFAKSRRQVSADRAGWLRKRLAPGIRAVGVFVDEEPEYVAALVRAGIIDGVQLHGEESRDYVRTLKEQAGCTVIKAMHLDARTVLRRELDGYAAAGADFFLFDSGCSAGMGGTGQTFDWGLIPEIPYPYFLAGGLDLENVEKAMAAAPAWGLDVSSGAETGGVKDRDKILEIVRRVRNV